MRVIYNLQDCRTDQNISHDIRTGSMKCLELQNVVFQWPINLRTDAVPVKTAADASVRARCVAAF